MIRPARADRMTFASFVTAVLNGRDVRVVQMTNRIGILSAIGAVARNGFLVTLMAALCFAFWTQDAFAQRGAQPVRIDAGGDSAVSQSIVLPLDKAAFALLF